MWDGFGAVALHEVDVDVDINVNINDNMHARRY